MYVETLPSGFDHPRLEVSRLPQLWSSYRHSHRFMCVKLKLPSSRFCTIRWKLYFSVMPC